MIRMAKRSKTSSNGKSLVCILRQIEEIDFVRALISKSNPSLAKASRIGCTKRRMKRLRTSFVLFNFDWMSLCTSVSVYIIAKSSNSVFMEYSPRRCASGAYRNFVSEAIFTCCSGFMELSVRMLWRRSANLIKTTRRSSEIVRIILRKFSACTDVFWSKASGILVKPSIIRRALTPNRSSTSWSVMCVSSTVSCNKAQAMEVAPKPISSAQIRATAIGW